MGSQTIMDIVGSTIVFGALLFNAFQLNYGSSESIQDFRGDLIVQQNLVAVTTLLEYDFRKIGYCKDYSKIPIATCSIRYADSSKIVFWTDIATPGLPSGDGNVDSLAYYVGPTSELGDTPNPKDRLIYRSVNNETPVGVRMGVTIFDLQYFDAFHNRLSTPVADPREIQSLQITVQVEHPIKFTKYYTNTKSDTLYQSASWRQIRLIAKNLNNR